MADGTRFVGLDYHQKQIQLCMLDGDGQVLTNKRCPNDWRALAAAVPADQPIQAAIEASPGAADLADQLSEQGGWSVSLPMPVTSRSSSRIRIRQTYRMPNCWQT
jgi:hypothetical protein